MMLTFGALLRAYREAAGSSQLALARQVGVDSGYISRLEAGTRATPSRELAQALGAALDLPAEGRDRLLAAAGYLPTSLASVGLDDPTVALVLRLLADERIPPGEVEEFRQIVRLVARRWLPDA